MSLRLLPLSMAIASLFPSFVYADNADNTKELATISVNAKTHKRSSNERINRTVLDNEMVQNNRDLVRYSTDVGIADQGRHSKGFAIRGVEDNRVGISIDGVSLPDSEENSLYKRYGNLNTSRQSIDTELARTVEVSKGADSFSQGSGNLGGGVNYRTLEPSDVVRDGNQFGGLLRSGYASRNNEWVNTVAAAYLGKQAEALVLYSNRHGHEMESNGDITLPNDEGRKNELGYWRQTPDKSTHDSHAFLTKFAYLFNHNHRAGLAFHGQQTKNHIIEDSALTLSSFTREADDKSKRRTVNVFYEYMPDSTWLSLIKADFDYQKTVTEADNFEGYRARIDWAGQFQPAMPSDTNLRTFNTNFKRFGLRMDTQALQLGKTQHTLSLKGAVSERNFDVLHEDSFYLSSTKTWSDVRRETMMHPVKTTHHFISLSNQIAFNPIFSGYAGIRYDWAKHSQQDLGDLSCRMCTKTDDARFKQWTWKLGLDAQLHQNWKLGYNIGTGFRMPNASEMYFDYRTNPAGAWMSNPNLKAERSLTQNLGLQGKGEYGELLINLHHTKYKDFIDEQETIEHFIENGYYGPKEKWRFVQQMRNRNKAKVYGFEATGRLNLHRISPLPEGWKLFASVGMSKGNMYDGTDLLSIQPPKAIIGLDYINPEDKWGIFSRLTYLGAKKPKYARYFNADYETEYDWWTGESTYTDTSSIKPWKHLNKKAFVLDLFGYYKPTQQLTLRAGIYNLLDRKYLTWDSLRGINNTGGVVNNAGRADAQGNYPGLERFYAPGRNFAVSVEYKF